MWLDFIFNRSGKFTTLHKLHHMFKQLTSMNKHLPDVSKKHDMVLNDQKFNLGVEILRLRGKISNTSDELQYDKIPLEDAQTHVNEYEKEFHAIRARFKSFKKRAH